MTSLFNRYICLYILGSYFFVSLSAMLHGQVRWIDRNLSFAKIEDFKEHDYIVLQICKWLC